jgi:hypothetical protein
MTMKKFEHVSVADDGVPVIVTPQPIDKTREIPVGEGCCVQDDERAAGEQSAPTVVVEDEVTVPVHSSIESTLTFELLRRQSGEAEEDEG